MTADNKRYESVKLAIGEATIKASELGWQGYELQAHVFLAALAAATGEAAAEPEPSADIADNDTGDA